MISLESEAKLMILGSYLEKVKSTQNVKHVIISSDQNPYQTGVFNTLIRNGIDLRTMIELHKIIKIGEKVEILDVKIPDSSLSNFYKREKQRCLRLFPTQVSGGVEKWQFLCENELSAQELLMEISLVPNTYVVDHIVEPVFSSRFDKIQSTISHSLSKAVPTSKAKMRVLKEAFNRGYYNTNTDVKLKEIALALGVSKSYVSKVLREEEKRFMTIYLPWLLYSSDNRN